MNGIDVLKQQLTVVHAMYQSHVGQISPSEWVARPLPTLNLPGFTAWHMLASQDWSTHVAILGQPEVRSSPRWKDLPGINPDHPPFGMTLAQADAIARAATPTELLAYAEDLHANMMALLDTLQDADLDRVCNVRAHARAYPAERINEDYLREAENMADWTIARHFTSPCIGHARGHFGELELHLALVRAVPTA